RPDRLVHRRVLRPLRQGRPRRRAAAADGPLARRRGRGRHRPAQGPECLLGLLPLAARPRAWRRDPRGLRGRPRGLPGARLRRRRARQLRLPARGAHPGRRRRPGDRRARLDPARVVPQPPFDLPAPPRAVRRADPPRPRAHQRPHGADGARSRCAAGADRPARARQGPLPGRGRGAHGPRPLVLGGADLPHLRGEAL
ncbi:MAG: hypothetical protein AVDCRST_MAG30-270, partial [uncultured Solirubrobacteraceae bacterium]